MSSVYLVIETKYTATIIRVMINAVIADTATDTRKFRPPFMPNLGLKRWTGALAALPLPAHPPRILG